MPNGYYPYPAPGYDPYAAYGSYPTPEQRLRELDERERERRRRYEYPQPEAPIPSAQDAFIEVSAADEAWAYHASQNPADWGKKQWFINKNGNEIYSKEFNANIPATLKIIYKRWEPDIQDDEIVEQSSDFSDRFDILENELRGLKEMILNGPKHDNEHSLQISVREDAGDRRDNESSNGSGKVKSKSRNSDGTFRKNS